MIKFHVLDQEDKYIHKIAIFIENIFLEINKSILIKGRDLIIFNKMEAKCPSFHYYFDIPTIFLHCPLGTSYWNKVIFQLSHEIMHYIFYLHKNDPKKIGKRFEEIVCEAVSLYVLSKSISNWTDCKLSIINKDYYCSIKEYLDIEMQKRLNGSYDLISKTNLDDWKKLEKECENNRDTHSKEVIYLYEILANHPQILVNLISYTKYLTDDGSVNFELWAENESLIKNITKIQPKIMY